MSGGTPVRVFGGISEGIMELISENIFGRNPVGNPEKTVEELLELYQRKYLGEFRKQLLEELQEYLLAKSQNDFFNEC